MSRSAISQKDYAALRGYHVVSLTLPLTYLERLDATVAQCKRDGNKRANRSWVIRCLMDEVTP